MAKIQGGVPVAGFMSPTDDSDVYAVTDEVYNRGGYRTVNTLTERDAITDDRRKLGMLVCVWGERKIYQWNGTEWVNPTGFGDKLPFIVSDTEPTDGGVGDMWLDTKSGVIYTKKEVTDDTDPDNPTTTEKWVSEVNTIADIIDSLDSKYATKDDISKVAKFQGYVDTKDDLPATPNNGDVYGVRDEHGAWYIYGETDDTWEPVDGANLDTSKIVDTDNEQDITGKKVFKGNVEVEVDAVNPTDAVNLKTLESKLQDVSEGALYSNDEPTTAAVGGIPVGTTFENKTISEVLDMLTHPYQEPAITALSTNYTQILEVGSSTANTITVSWSTSNQSNITPDSLTITVNGVDVTPTDPLPLQGNKEFTITPLTRDTDGTLQVKAEATDVKNKTISKTTNITWKSAIYYGTSESTSLTGTEIVALQNKLLDDKFKRSYSFPGGGYKYVAYPTRLGNAVNFFNTVNNLPVPVEKLPDVEVTNANGVTQTYALYRTTNILGGAIDITFA